MQYSNTSASLLIALAAGLCMLIGASAVFAARKEHKKLLTISLGFAAGVMLTISFGDMLPHAEEHFEAAASHLAASALSVLFLLLGAGLCALFEHIVPHSHDLDELPETDGGDDHELCKTGIMAAVAIGLHNLPEGMAIFVAGMDSIPLGISAAMATALHNIPAGAIIALPIYYATKSKGKAFLYTLLSALAEPLGAVIAYFLLGAGVGDIPLGIVFAVSSGIMLYMTFDELIPSARQDGREHLALWSIFAGVAVMMMIHVH